MNKKCAFKEMLIGIILGVLLLGSLGTVSASEADTTVIVSSTEASTEYSSTSSDNGIESTENIKAGTENIEGNSMDDNSASPQTGRVDFPLLLLIGFLGFTVTAVCAKKKDAF